MKYCHLPATLLVLQFAFSGVRTLYLGYPPYPYSPFEMSGDDDVMETTSQKIVMTTAVPTSAGAGKCGSPLQVRKIVHGTRTVLSRWPWQVSIFRDGEHDCGGAIINERYVVTVAHCVEPDKPEDYAIVAGVNDVLSDVARDVMNPVESAINHHRYTGEDDNNAYDISVIKTKFAIKFGKNAQPICLPAKGELPKAGENCFITGWGATKDYEDAVEGDGSDFSRFLMQARTQIIGDESCSLYYGENLTPDLMICGSARNGDSCQGDSGGPLQCRRATGEWYLAGVTSWGLKCGGNPPGVYTQVEHFINFINYAVARMA